MKFPTLEREEQLAGLVDEIGFLPFFKGEIPGFSIEEMTPPELWFGEEPGPWEWKGPVITQSGCAYGKFFLGKAVFISRAWFPDFANHRRDGYDFDARYDDGLASFREKRLFDVLAGEESLLSKEWRSRALADGGELKGFDTTVTKLQHRCYVTTVNFEYALDKQGRPYGWGVARYATPEARFGEDFTERVYQRQPEESAQWVLEHLEKLLPQANERQLLKLLG
ncbi:MAG: hypothetical protein J6C43_05875 [Oscillospiraceae bacterium]|nr:hypothetical protein [Oscillospiraceae bacterium]MBP3519833.1 hypothetical protein [Oscillospiraceae bacterium]